MNIEQLRRSIIPPMVALKSSFGLQPAIHSFVFDGKLIPGGVIRVIRTPLWFWAVEEESKQPNNDWRCPKCGKVISTKPGAVNRCDEKVCAMWRLGFKEEPK